MNILKKINIAFLVILSFAAGIPKVMQMQHELDFFQGLGLGGQWVVLLGLSQLIGAALLIFQKTRLIGAVVVTATLAISSLAVFQSGDLGFGLFSLLPFVLAVFAMIDASRVGRAKAAAETRNTDPVQ